MCHVIRRGRVAAVAGTCGFVGGSSSIELKVYTHTCFKSTILVFYKFFVRIKVSFVLLPLQS